MCVDDVVGLRVEPSVCVCVWMMWSDACVCVWMMSD